ncbi:hypothetical protein MPER_13132 [Moniliophthora perniciosa FA553]|nr:hypothetical protein MPER_13132 [Moniliophthora perniciosa FA553]
MLVSAGRWISISAVKFKITLLKAFSIFDRRGEIYCFHIVDPNEPGFLLKIGRTSRPLEQRKAEWALQCPSRLQLWYEGVAVDHSHRVERLVHLALMSDGVERVLERCRDCGKVHQEIFRFHRADAWDKVVKPLILDVDARVEGRN